MFSYFGARDLGPGPKGGGARRRFGAQVSGSVMTNKYENKCTEKLWANMEWPFSSPKRLTNSLNNCEACILVSFKFHNAHAVSWIVNYCDCFSCLENAPGASWTATMHHESPQFIIAYSWRIVSAYDPSWVLMSDMGTHDASWIFMLHHECLDYELLDQNLASDLASNGTP